MNKTQKKKSRYCQGRRPVTDFVVGQSYPGKVVYVKPFGIFLDINCHSDAFCHVSRLCDDHVESPEALFQPGDVVPAVRVLEVDRERKRITVSLQSESMREQELESIQARKHRKEKLAKKLPSMKKNNGGGADKPNVALARHENAPTKNHQAAIEDSKDPIVPLEHRPGPPNSSITKPESEMTPAELKRARKIARRAARRAERECTE